MCVWGGAHGQGQVPLYPSRVPWLGMHPMPAFEWMQPCGLGLPCQQPGQRRCPQWSHALINSKEINGDQCLPTGLPALACRCCPRSTSTPPCRASWTARPPRWTACWASSGTRILHPPWRSGMRSSCCSEPGLTAVSPARCAEARTPPPWPSGTRSSCCSEPRALR